MQPFKAWLWWESREGPEDPEGAPDLLFGWNPFLCGGRHAAVGTKPKLFYLRNASGGRGSVVRPVIRKRRSRIMCRPSVVGRTKPSNRDKFPRWKKRWWGCSHCWQEVALGSTYPAGVDEGNIGTMGTITGDSCVGEDILSTSVGPAWEGVNISNIPSKKSRTSAFWPSYLSWWSQLSYAWLETQQLDHSHKDVY